MFMFMFNVAYDNITGASKLFARVSALFLGLVHPNITNGNLVISLTCTRCKSSFDK